MGADSHDVGARCGGGFDADRPALALVDELARQQDIASSVNRAGKSFAVGLMTARKNEAGTVLLNHTPRVAHATHKRWEAALGDPVGGMPRSRNVQYRRGGGGCWVWRW